MNTNPPISITTAQITERVNGNLLGDGDITLHAMEMLRWASETDLTFVGEKKYIPDWLQSFARAALVNHDLKDQVQPQPDRALIFVDDVDMASITAARIFAPPKNESPTGINENATIDSSASVPQSAGIAAGCYIGPGVSIGENVTLHPNVTILDNASIDDNSELHPGVVIGERCEIGKRCIIHPNTTVGADGFGYRPAPDGKGIVKIPHYGIVKIGNDVEIGAGTCIDRGKFSLTEIGDGTKIDNLVQIAHNCRIGRCVIICGQCGIAGTVEIGDGATLGGNVGLKDHIRIGAGATVAASSAVMDDVPPGETWAGYPAMELSATMRTVLASRKLPDLIKKLKPYLRQLEAGEL